MAKAPNSAKLYDTFRTTPLGKKDGKFYGIPVLLGDQSDRLPRRSDEPASPTGRYFSPEDKYKGRLAMRDYALEGVMIAAMYLGFRVTRCLLWTTRSWPR